MGTNKKLIIVGDSAFAEVAFECFTHDSDYEVAGFAVEKAYRHKEELCGLPVVDFETVESSFAPDEHSVFAALVYTQLNRLRERLAYEAKAKGYSLASYISSRAFVWHNVEMGEHCFIFENNTIQPFVVIGNNVVLWSGNHIGHHSIIRDHAFISSQVVVSGFVTLGEYCFLGVNSTLANNVTIARDCWIGPGVLISNDTQPGQLFKSAPTKPSQASTHRFFKTKG